MANAGRRRLTNHRRSSGAPARSGAFGAAVRRPFGAQTRPRPLGAATRRPFGAPCQHWWLDDPTLPGLGAPAGHPGPGDPADQPWPGAPCQHWWLDDPAPQAWPDPPTRHRWLHAATQRRWLQAATQRRWLHAATQRRWLQAASRRRWLQAATRHPWYLAFGLGAGFMALAGGAILIVGNQSPSAQATGCGQVPCAAPMEPPAVTIPGPIASPSATQPQVPPSPRAASGTGQAGAASATPSAASQLPPSVTVTYRLVAQWAGGALGEFTVTNIGSTSITGWELSAAFPGDQIQPVWGSSAPDGGNVLVMEATPDAPAIAPGSSQSGDFIAQGDTIVPSDCTVNGVACPGYSTRDSPDGST